MSAIPDPLAEAETLDRVFYATGILLDARDFQDEQNYHRGRLARALAAVCGCGTIAGLEVQYELEQAPGKTVEHLMVQPGLALDRLGRLIELPHAYCLRLDNWYAQLAGSSDQSKVDALRNAYKGAPYNGVVADVFVRFVACAQRKTPAIASGPFDALDAVQPSRLRDAFDIELVPRPEGNLAACVPANPWPDLTGLPDAAARGRALRDAVLKAWPQEGDDAPTGSEYAVTQTDKTGVFLARIVIQASAPVGVKAPARPIPLPANSVTVDNDPRLLVYTTQALARALGF